MQSELRELLSIVPLAADRDSYASAITTDNVLGKETASNRRLTKQRLTELYGLDPRVPVFSVLRRVWDVDPAGRPLSAHLCALARDPLLRATADHVLQLPPGAELVRGEFLASIRDHVEARLNDAILDKVARNAGSSWSQSGHLVGRVRKHRVRVKASFGPVAFALWLGHLEDRVSDELLTSFWMNIFDSPRHVIIDEIIKAKQIGLLRASIGDDVVQIDPSSVLPAPIGV